MTTPWNALGAGDYTLIGVRAVLPDRLLPDATVVVRGGLIDDIHHGTVPGHHHDPVLEGNGALLLPGLIDVHTDGLEAALSPRAGAGMPPDFALADFESRLAAAGITTTFHAVGFRATTAHGSPRPPGHATRLHALIRHAPSTRVDHRVLHRLDLLCATGRAELTTTLGTYPAPPGTTDAAPLVSLEDHTPGQGQYRNPQVLVDYIAATDGVDHQAATRQVERLHRRAQEQKATKEDTFGQFFDLAAHQQVRLMLHDPDTTKVVDDFADRGGTVAEFPTTLEAARQARRRGLLVVAGAPNVVRGRSHSGNVSATELLTEECVDALASDYLPAALLGAAATLVRSGHSWPQATALITSGPARVAGLTDRGRLLPGQRADLILLDDRAGHWPVVCWSMRAGPARADLGQDQHQ
jgi:alpha-D-ribose 1-methylphosphonate 5-triphosphate diphosphatase